MRLISIVLVSASARALLFPFLENFCTVIGYLLFLVASHTIACGKNQREPSQDS